MTGAYIRIKRGDEWENIEFDQLTDSEMNQVAADQPDRGWTWALFFARWIRDNIKDSEIEP